MEWYWTDGSNHITKSFCDHGCTRNERFLHHFKPQHLCIGSYLFCNFSIISNFKIAKQNLLKKKMLNLHISVVCTGNVFIEDLMGISVVWLTDFPDVSVTQWAHLLTSNRKLSLCVCEYCVCKELKRVINSNSVFYIWGMWGQNFSWCRFPHSFPSW